MGRVFGEIGPATQRTVGALWSDEEFQSFSDVPEEPRTLDSRFQTFQEITKGAEGRVKRGSWEKGE